MRQGVLSRHPELCQTGGVPDFNYSDSAGRGNWRLYGGRIFAATPARLKVSPSESDLEPLELTADLELDIVDGRLACTSVTVSRLEGGPPVTSERLRRIPIAQWVSWAAEDIAIREIVSDSKTRRFDWPPAEFALDGPTPEALEQVARVYAYCMATGRAPTQELATRYGITKQTGSRWIATARRRGILVDEHQRFA